MNESRNAAMSEQEEMITNVSSEQRCEDMVAEELSTDSDNRRTDSPSTTWDKLMMNDLVEFPTRTNQSSFLHDGGVTAFVMGEDANSGDAVTSVKARGEKRSGDMNVIGSGRTMLLPPKMPIEPVSSDALATAVGILPPVQRQFGVNSSSSGLDTQQQHQYQAASMPGSSLVTMAGERSLPPYPPPSTREPQKNEQPMTAAMAAGMTTGAPGKTMSTAIRRRRSVSSLSTRVQELLIGVIERATEPRSVLKRACGIVEPGEPGYGDSEALIQTWERVRDSRGRHVLMTGRSTFAVLPQCNDDTLTTTATEQTASGTCDAMAKDASMAAANAMAGHAPSQTNGAFVTLESVPESSLATAAAAQGTSATPSTSGKSGGRNARGFSAFRHASRQYYFHTDALEGHMDLPGRVWSQCTWEYSHNAQLYDRAEYARIWIAASTGVRSSLAVPVIYPAGTVLKPGLGRAGAGSSGGVGIDAKYGKGPLQFSQHGDVQSGIQYPHAASIECLGRPGPSEQVVAVLEVVHSSSITDVRPLLDAVSVLLSEVGLRAGGFKPGLCLGPTIPLLRTNEERAAAELSALMNQLAGTMDLPLVQLWKVLPSALGIPTIMVTGTLPFVAHGDHDMMVFREACCNAALADGIGPVGCCKQHGGSPQWWPRVGAELMCNFPVAHVARAKNLHGIVAMGVRWTGTGPSVDSNDHDASAAATLDFVIECVLPARLEDPYSQKDVAVKCCESLWQLSSRDEYHLFPLTGDGMATSVTLRGGLNGGGAGTSVQVALFSSNMGDVSAISDQTTSQVAQDMASMMSPAAAVDVRASGVGGGALMTGAGSLSLTRAVPPVSGHATSSYQHSQRGFFTANDVKTSGTVVPVGGGKGIFQFTSVLPLEQQPPPLSLANADNRHADLSSVSVFRSMDPGGGRVVDKHGMGVQLRTAHETRSGPAGAVKMNIYNEGVLPLLSPGFVVHFVGSPNEAAVLDPSMRSSSASGNSIVAHVNINAHDPLALEEVRNALLHAGLVVQIGNECMVGRNRYISMVVSRPSWAGHRSSTMTDEVKRWVYSDTWKIMAAFEAFGFLALPTPLLSYTRDESADMKFAAECLSELRAIESELLEE